MLQEYGWNDSLAAAFATWSQKGCYPARVVSRRGRHYRLVAEPGEVDAWLPGRLARSPDTEPAVGDWVAVRPTSDREVIEGTLPRRSSVSRLAAGKATREQVVAANVDTLLVVMGLDEDFNLRRLERYLALAFESGAQPVVVLNKLDLDDDQEGHRAAAEAVAPGVAVYCTCALTGTGVNDLDPHLEPGCTVALIGSSGAGKSTLANWLMGSDVMETREVWERDGQGTHTTTHREMLRLPGGALLIDNPGLREVAAWSEGDGWRQAFADVEEYAVSCRFRDCTHVDEPGCAVRDAVTKGQLPAERLESWVALRAELAGVAQRRDEAARRRHRRVGSKALRRHKPRES